MVRGERRQDVRGVGAMGSLELAAYGVREDVEVALDVTHSHQHLVFYLRISIDTEEEDDERVSRLNRCG